MIDTPVLAEIGEQPVAVLRLAVPRARIQQVKGPGLQELRAAVAAQGIAVTGPWLTDDLRERYVAGPESGPDPAGWRAELNRPVTGAAPASGATGG